MSDGYRTTIADTEYDPMDADGLQERSGRERRPRGDELASGMIGLMGAASDFDLYGGDWKLGAEGNSAVKQACEGLARSVKGMQSEDGKIRDPYGAKSMAALTGFAESLSKLDVRMLDGEPAAKLTDPGQSLSESNPMVLFGHEVRYAMDAFDSIGELGYCLQPDAMAYLHVSLVNRPVMNQKDSLLFSSYTSELTQDAADSLVQAASGGHEAEAHDRFCRSLYECHMANESQWAAHAGKPQASPTAMVQMFKDSYERASQERPSYDRFLEDAKAIHQASTLAGRMEKAPGMPVEYYDEAALPGNDRASLDIAGLKDRSLQAVWRMSKAAGVTIEDGKSVSLFGRDISLEDTGRDAFLAIQDFMKGAQDAQLEQNFPALQGAAKSEAVKGRMAQAAQPAEQVSAKDRQAGD